MKTKLIYGTLLAFGLVTAPNLAQASDPAPEPASPPVLQQDDGEPEEEDEDDELDKLIYGDPDEEKSVREERRALEEEAEREAQGGTTVEIAPPKKRVIKPLQPKKIMKLGRFEVVPYVGLVTNDPFIRRVMFGADLGYHITEVFGVELQGSFSPNFGEGDWKPITSQIINANQVSPEISRMMWHAVATFNFSPFYGKVATVGRTTIIFDIYGLFGAGVVGTSDDLTIIQKEEDAKALATQTQVHPAISFGGGLRVAFNKTFALRFEARDISYIGVLESVQLELKNNLALMLGASIFFGRRIE